MLRRGRVSNWAGNQRCSPRRVERPAGEDELAEVLRRAAGDGERVRPVGAGRSSSGLAWTDGVLVDLSRMDQVLDVAPSTGRVTVQAGMSLRRLNAELDAVGLALPDQPEVDALTVAGAISTGTHGTGTGQGGLASRVAALVLVVPDGTVLRCDRNNEADVFAAARVGLGAVGVLSAVTFETVPSFRLHAVEEPMRLEAVLEDLDELSRGNDHLEVAWVPHTSWCLTRRLNRTDEPVRGLSGYRYVRDKVLVENVGFGAVVTAGRVAPWVGRRVASVVAGTGRTEYVEVSHRALTSPRLVRHVAMEYALPRAALRRCLLELVERHRRSGIYVSFPVEVRWGRGDDIPLSPASGRDTAYVAVSMARGTPSEPWFRIAEAVFDEVGGRPHWGRVHYQRAESLAPRYPQWDRFQRVRRRLDPEGRLDNPELRRVLGRPF